MPWLKRSYLGHRSQPARPFPARRQCKVHQRETGQVSRIARNPRYTIAEAKNNLSQLIHQLETGEVIHLTRYGKPVAVLISENQYQRVIGTNKSLNSAILNWRSQLDQNDDIGFNDKELQALRKESGTGREFAWTD